MSTAVYLAIHYSCRLIHTSRCTAQSLGIRTLLYSLEQHRHPGTSSESVNRSFVTPKSYPTAHPRGSQGLLFIDMKQVPELMRRSVLISLICGTLYILECYSILFVLLCTVVHACISLDRARPPFSLYKEVSETHFEVENYMKVRLTFPYACPQRLPASTQALA